MKNWQNRLLNLLTVLALLLPLLRVEAAPSWQAGSPQEQAQSLLERLTPEERVGQLFLVTFNGREVDSQTQIYDLIVNHHIGGVILQAANNNFSTGEAALSSLLQMNRSLQMDRWNAVRQSQTDAASGGGILNYVPLWIGISQEGDGYPYDQILQGLTQLPNEMAIGATWNPDLAKQVGTVLGKEISALGFNLLFGPSLDVLETPLPEGKSDLGTRAFGGDPFWVGVMGQAYTRGVHEGSNGRVAVIAKHFPGNGGSDRLPEEEVATVRKSLEELKNYDLAPFFSVTGNAPDPGSTVDALLASHIRYQGFQENIRATTRPVSFDPQAFSLLMSLPPLAAWRENGGIMISDNLGSQAVRRFYELTGQSYDAYRAALNAFLAGNDLLYLGDVTTGEDPDAYTSTVRVLEFFAQKYLNDPDFARDVDASVLRILTLKFRLYTNFTLASTLPVFESLGQVGQAGQVTFDVARQAATLISPPLAELDDALPDPPNLNDRIVFITDERVMQQCSECPVQTIFERGALQQAVARLYGPQAANQILPTNLSSYSFGDLQEMLDKSKTDTAIEADLQRAHWIVFSTLNLTDQVPESSALRRFLSERPDLFQQKRLIIFAFNAPYYLDATNISKVTAYYGLYSKSARFIDVAARLLFREIRPEGALPISVPGIGYDLITATSPDPDQLIELYPDLPGLEIPDSTAITSTVAAPLPEFRVGDLIPVRTGIILDKNGHPVPDGTPVQFLTSVGGVVSAPALVENTVSGVARTTIQVTSPGPLEILAQSDLAKSAILRFDIPGENNLAPTQTITPTPEPTLTPVPTPTITPTVAPAEPAAEPPPSRPALLDWLLALVLSAGAGYGTFRLAIYVGAMRWAIRGGFLALIGGMLGYSYLALQLPGSEQLLDSSGSWGVVLVALLGSLSGMIAAWAWRAYKTGTLWLRPEA